MKSRFNWAGFVFWAMIILFFLFAAFAANACYGQELFQWRWSHDPVMKNPDASGLHLIGSAYLAGTMDNTSQWWKSDLTIFTVGLLWEVKDGLLPWEKVGVLGGEGFSVNDLKMDISGLVIHRLGVLAYNRVKYHQWNLNKIERRRK